MAPKGSPKERLSRLFHRSPGNKTTSQTFDSPPSSPSSPNSPYGQDYKRNASSRTSVRDLATRRTSRSHARHPSEEVPSAPSYGAQVAASKALGVDSQLPRIPHQSNLSSDIQNLALNDDSNEGRYSEHVADSNRSGNRYSAQLDRDDDNAGHSQNESDRTFSGSSGSPTLHSRRAQNNLRDTSFDQQRPLGPRSQPLLPKVDLHSRNVADRNIVQNETSVLGAREQVSAPLKFNKRSTDGDSRASRESQYVTAANSFGSLKTTARKPVNGTRISQDSRNSVDLHSVSPIPAPRGSIGSGHRSIPRPSLDKPLPSTPSAKTAPEPPGLSEIHSELGPERGYLVKDATSPIDLTGIVNLTNTVDTTLHERWAPAVVHETVIPRVHEILEEQITREIHNHDIYHRILPVVDVEVKPARHFIPVEGGYAEVAAEELPGRTGDQTNWVIAELVSKSLPPSQQANGPRQFTARNFNDTEGDSKEYFAPEGYPKTERHWVHPPTVEDGGRLTGQTYPFHFGSADSRDDGLRAHLPEGEVIGASELYARKMRDQQIGGGAEPPVPTHHELPIRSHVPNANDELEASRENLSSPRFI